VRDFQGVRKRGGGARFVYVGRERMYAVCHAPTLVKEAGSQVLGIGMK